MIPPSYKLEGYNENVQKSMSSAQFGRVQNNKAIYNFMSSCLPGVILSKGLPFWIQYSLS